MQNFQLQDLLEAGSHFGHETKRWNPKMEPFIFTTRNDVHIIDLEKTLELAPRAFEFLEKVVAEGGEVLFVGTKRQAKEIIREQAKRCGMMYVNDRWLGGLLTNFSSIKKTIQNYNELLEKGKSEEFQKMPKKDQSIFQKKFAKLDKSVGGVKDLKKVPDALFVLDVKREKIAVNEANKMKIPIVAICDTNVDPDKIDYIIPGNDDAMKSIQLFVASIADAVIKGRSEEKLKSESPKKIAKEKEDKGKAPVEKPEVQENPKAMNSDQEIEELGLSSRTEVALKKAGISKVSELKSIDEGKLLEIKGLGEKSLEEIRGKLA